MKVKLTNVRLSFPQVFKPKAFGETESEPKYSASFVLDKVADKKQIADLKNKLVEVKAASSIKDAKGVMLCLKDGASKPDIEGYGEGIMFLSASNTRKPAIVDRDPSKHILPEDDKIYGGCMVNAVINLWAQNNKFGKRINASLETIQWVAPGSRFGAPPVDPEEEFENLSGTDDDDNPAA